MSATPPPADDSMGERAASAVGLDIDWSTVDPAARASMEMALAMGANFDGPLAQRAAAAQAQEAADGRAAAHEAAMAATGRDWDSELRRLEAELAEADAAAGERDDASDEHESPDASAGPAKGTTAPDDAGSTACGVDDDGDDHEGMGAPAGTAEASWGGDDADWALARIVRRRKHHGPVGSFDPDVAAEDMRWEYLCAWEGHGEATWERRAWLQDYGLGDRVAAFDAERAVVGPSASKPLRPKKPNRANLEQIKAAEAAFAHLDAFTHAVAAASAGLDQGWRLLISHWDGTHRAPLSGLAFFSRPETPAISHFRRMLEAHDSACVPGLSRFLFAVLTALSHDPWYTVDAVGPVFPTSAVELADNLAASRRSDPAALRLVFHGARSAVPETATSEKRDVAVGVSHHGAQGFGVYSFDAVNGAFLNSLSSGVVFVCLAVDDGAGVTHARNGAHVYVDEHSVVPLLRMSVRDRAAGDRQWHDASHGVMALVGLPLVQAM